MEKNEISAAFLHFACTLLVRYQGGLHWTPEKIALIFFIEYLSFIKERSITAQTWWQTYNFCYYSILRFSFSVFP